MKNTEKSKKTILKLDKLSLTKLTSLNVIKGGREDDEITVIRDGGSTRACM